MRLLCILKSMENRRAILCEFQHPVAKAKLDVLDWNIKHTMWHCGQLGILVMIAGERFNFDLRREPS